MGVINVDCKYFVKICFLLFLLIGNGASASINAYADSPERPKPGLPERPSPPTSGQAEEPSGNEVGGHIELSLDSFNIRYWTEVEWQDSAGQWHIVDGWRGCSTNQGFTRWFVETTDFGKGPFRWQVYNLSDKGLVASSRDFYLPRKQFETVMVEIDEDSKQ